MKKKKANDGLHPIPIAIGFIDFFITHNFKQAFIIWLILEITIIIFLIIKANKKKEMYIRSGIDIVDKLTGEEFETFLHCHFERLGYSVKDTPKTNDYGADLILKKEGIITIVQAKRYSSKVGISAIQEVIGAKAYYNGSKCLVVTNNYFTSSATNLAASSEVELWDRKVLLDVMAKANGREILVKDFDVPKIRNRHICKKCGSNLIYKVGKYGDFYGCSNYPKCRYTETLE